MKSQKSKVNPPLTPPRRGSQESKVLFSSEVVEVARGLIDTPYKFQGRVPGVGCDCIGLVILTAWELGLFEFDERPRAADRRKGTREFDFRNYSRNPGSILEPEVKKHCQPLSELTEGALALFAIANVTQHCGIISHYRNDWGLIHAYENVGMVKEHRLINWWKDKLVGIYKLPNVTYF